LTISRCFIIIRGLKNFAELDIVKKMDLNLKDLAALLYVSGKMLCRRTKDKNTPWLRVEWL